MLESHLTFVQKSLNLNSRGNVVPSKKVDADSYIQSPQTDFQKGAQVASEDVITTQRDDSEFDETRDRDFYENT